MLCAVHGKSSTTPMTRSPGLGCAILVAALGLADEAAATEWLGGAAPYERNPPVTIDDCEDRYLPAGVSPGKDVVWMPTPDYLVDAMLTLAEVGPDDYLIDLGAGDGRIAIAAARDYGARALGIEYDPEILRLAECMVRISGVGERVTLVQGDIFVEDFSDASVLTLFLLPELNRCIRHRVLAMRPGTRVVSHQFRMGLWRNDDLVIENDRVAYLWVVPARVGGSWAFHDPEGSLVFTLDLEQHFQQLDGTIHRDGHVLRLDEIALRGDVIEFRFIHATGPSARFRGRVDGTTIRGEIEVGGTPGRPLMGSFRGEPSPAAWMEMHEGCESYYDR
jgi:SAM-dependent methyltransferase